MSRLSESVVRFLYPLRERISPGKRVRLACDFVDDDAARLILDSLSSTNPCMIGRFGATELAAMVCLSDIARDIPRLEKYWKVLRGEMRAVDKWNPRIRRHMADWSGFFPLTDEALADFVRIMERDAQSLDVLGSWLADEVRVRTLFPDAKVIPIDVILRPDRQEIPWTSGLAGKKVLVVHPFSQSIESQYARRELVWPRKKILPEFELITLKSVQSLSGQNTEFASWFEALSWMEDEIGQIDFDVALIGCGAYGFPLAAHVKRLKRKAVHVGGALQLFFGIMGKRWEQDESLKAVVNGCWIHPAAVERPVNFRNVEGGCYW